MRFGLIRMQSGHRSLGRKSRLVRRRWRHRKPSDCHSSGKPLPPRVTPAVASFHRKEHFVVMINPMTSLRHSNKHEDSGGIISIFPNRKSIGKHEDLEGTVPLPLTYLRAEYCSPTSLIHSCRIGLPNWNSPAKEDCDSLSPRDLGYFLGPDGGVMLHDVIVSEARPVVIVIHDWHLTVLGLGFAPEPEPPMAAIVESFFTAFFVAG